MLKVPPLTALHKQGHISSGHLDDFYIQGQNYELRVHNVIDRIILFTTFTISCLKTKEKTLDAKMVLSAAAKLELDWWINNITSTYHVISHG